MISLSITPNPFAPINHACPHCGAQPADDCRGAGLGPSDGLWRIYHQERIDLAVKRGSEGWEASRMKDAIARRG